MNDTIRFVARPGFIIREIAGEQLLIPVNTGEIRLTEGGTLNSFNGMVRLNPIGVFLWEQLKTPKTLPELMQAVETSFETNGQPIRDHIHAYLDEGIRNQVIFLVPDGPESKNS